ncbi:hypothetical protein NPIL_625771 [Nephila pilipes]|uniref:Uncharacterized protein n=1 Tax=Nephila pilipes TaxID=299642 RepID=A0A8X6Q5G6_NEPPI|nr:hypothetical protein NPIL_625771 [Nephila pilipes]
MTKELGEQRAACDRNTCSCRSRRGCNITPQQQEVTSSFSLCSKTQFPQTNTLEWVATLHNSTMETRIIESFSDFSLRHTSVLLDLSTSERRSWEVFSRGNEVVLDLWEFRDMRCELNGTWYV